MPSGYGVYGYEYRNIISGRIVALEVKDIGPVPVIPAKIKKGKVHSEKNVT